jgi:hypothetical protein
VQLEHPPSVQNGFAVLTPDDEPGAPARGSPARADAPAPRHAQMIPELVAALEPQNEVLPHRLDRHETTAVEAARIDRSLPPWIRGLDLDALADEDL